MYKISYGLFSSLRSIVKISCVHNHNLSILKITLLTKFYILKQKKKIHVLKQANENTCQVTQYVFFFKLLGEISSMENPLWPNEDATPRCWKVPSAAHLTCLVHIFSTFSSRDLQTLR